jgi:hypothetical protein
MKRMTESQNLASQDFGMKFETYLKRATRGIWGKRRTDAILELRGNIEARIWTLEHQGKTQAEALEMALQELGDPRVVRAGFVQVQSVPSTLRAVVLAVMTIWISFPFSPIEARVQASPSFDLFGNVLSFEISARSLEQALLVVPEASTRFSVARALGTSEPTMDLEQVLQALCADAVVTLNQNRDTVAFTVEGRPRWALTLEVSQPVARAWHERHRDDTNCR